jgi:probable phosphoglycerate mutase
VHLVIVRHGERRSGALEHEDLGLTERGREQARRLGAWLREEGWRFTGLYASTLPRARETAELVGAELGLTPRLEPRLREAGSCDPSGAPIPDEAPAPYGFAPRDRPDAPVRPAGESWSQFRGRVAEALRAVLAEHAGATDCAGLICHSGVHNAAYEILEGLDRVSRVEWAVALTGFTHYEQVRGAWILRAHNVTDHLGRPPR